MILCPLARFLDLSHYFCSNIGSCSEPLKTHNSKSTGLIGMIQKMFFVFLFLFLFCFVLLLCLFLLLLLFLFVCFSLVLVLFFVLFCFVFYLSSIQ